MGFKELLSDYRDDQQTKRLGYERSRGLQLLEERKKTWHKKIVPGFKILDHFGTQVQYEPKELYLIQTLHDYYQK